MKIVVVSLALAVAVPMPALADDDAVYCEGILSSFHLIFEEIQGYGIEYSFERQQRSSQIE